MQGYLEQLRDMAAGLKDLMRAYHSKKINKYKYKNLW